MFREMLTVTFACSVALVQAQSVSAQSAPRAESLAFEVASVRPNTGSDRSISFGPMPPDGISLVNNPLESIIRYAYQVQPFRLVGVPGWASDARFDITAKASRPITDVELSWRPDVAGVATDPNDARPSFFTAIEEQLGMKLTAGRRPVDVLIVESVDRPTPD